MQALQDWMLALGVGVLVAIDVVILLVYDVLEGTKGNLEAKRFQNRENQQDLEGVSGIIEGQGDCVDV